MNCEEICFNFYQIVIEKTIDQLLPPAPTATTLPLTRNANEKLIVFMILYSELYFIIKSSMKIVYQYQIYLCVLTIEYMYRHRQGYCCISNTVTVFNFKPHEMII